MALRCPQCATPMNEVKAEVKSGYLVLLDQCRQCGGMWCDRWELYPVTTAAAERIDPVDRAALQQPATCKEEPLECPRCRARMFRFRDPRLPPDARIERCPNCDGMWLNRGELRRFKEHAGSSEPASSAAQPPVGDEELDRLTHQALDPKSWPTVTTLDDALDGRQQQAVDDDELREQLKSDALWLIARTALRLLLRV